MRVLNSYEEPSISVPRRAYLQWIEVSAHPPVADGTDGHHPQSRLLKDDPNHTATPVAGDPSTVGAILSGGTPCSANPYPTPYGHLQARIYANDVRGHKHTDAPGQKTRMEVGPRHPDRGTARIDSGEEKAPTGVRTPSDKTFRPLSRRR